MRWRCARCSALIEDDPAAPTLAREGGHAFVSSSLRPYLIAALADRRRAGAARGRRWSSSATTARRATWPPTCARGCAAPGALLPLPRGRLRVPSGAAAAPRGLRVAALDALLAARRRAPGSAGDGRREDAGGWAAGDGAPPVVVVSAVALSEKVPDPALRPHSFTLRVGELLDLDECAAELVAAGYERVDQVEERGQFAMRGGLLDVFPATEDRAVRVDMFDVEIESLRWFSTFTQRSLGDVDRGRDRAGGRAGRSSTASWRRSPRPNSGRPEVDRAIGYAGWSRQRPRERPGHRRAAAGRALRRAAGPARRGHRARRRRRGGAGAGAERPLDRRVRGVRRRGRAPPVRKPATTVESALAGRARSLAVGDLSRPAARAARPGGGHRRRARWPRPSRSWRSWCAPAIARSSRSRAAARASARPTTSGALKASWLGEDVDAGARRSSRRCASRRPRCARASSRRR